MYYVLCKVSKWTQLGSDAFHHVHMHNLTSHGSFPHPHSVEALPFICIAGCEIPRSSKDNLVIQSRQCVCVIVINRKRPLGTQCALESGFTWTLVTIPPLPATPRPLPTLPEGTKVPGTESPTNGRLIMELYHLSSSSFCSVSRCPGEAPRQETSHLVIHCPKANSPRSACLHVITLFHTCASSWHQPRP